MTGQTDDLEVMCARRCCACRVTKPIEKFGLCRGRRSGSVCSRCYDVATRRGLGVVPGTRSTARAMAVTDLGWAYFGRGKGGRRNSLMGTDK